MNTTTPTKEFDILLYGATSFVGKIMISYLANYAEKTFSWAIAGRDEQKLLALKKEHGLTSVPHFVADAGDETALTALCEKTNVIISTVGPYALYGETLVKVCANTGTDYCDLTGEPQWIKAMLDKYEPQAQASGARIINCSGFDSIPSDLGVYFSQQSAIEKTGSPATQIKMRVYKIKGAASGGTIASMLNVLKEVSDNPSLRKLLVNPYMLCNAGHPFHLRQKKQNTTTTLAFGQCPLLWQPLTNVLFIAVINCLVLCMEKTSNTMKLCRAKPLARHG